MEEKGKAFRNIYCMAPLYAAGTISLHDQGRDNTYQQYAISSNSNRTHRRRCRRCLPRPRR